MKRLSTKRNGFTLIELTVAVFVISLFTILIMNFLIDKLAENARLQARSNLQLQAKIALDTINDTIKHGTGAGDQNRWADDNAPQVGDPYSWEGDGDTLIITQPAQNSSKNILFENTIGYITYKDDHVFFVSDGTLYHRVLAATVSGNTATTTCPEQLASATCLADPKLAKNVSGFTTNYYNNNGAEVTVPSEASSVKLTLQLTRTIFGRTISESHSLTSVFRGIN